MTVNLYGRTDKVDKVKFKIEDLQKLDTEVFLNA